MKFVGMRDGRTVTVGRLFDSDAGTATVAPVAEVGDFYADLAGSLAAAAALDGGTVARADIAEVPAVPASARVLCVGLNAAFEGAKELVRILLTHILLEAEQCDRGGSRKL